MARKMLRNDQWARIESMLPGKAGDRGVTAKDNRLFVEAILWDRSRRRTMARLTRSIRALEQRVQAVLALVE